QASGAPSDPCLGAWPRSLSTERMTPIGRSQKRAFMSTRRLTASAPGPLGCASLGDSRLGIFPTGVEGVPRLVDVDHERGMIRRNGLSLARFAIDLGPDHARRERSRDQAMIDAHAEVLVEMASTIVPPGVALRLRVRGAIGIDESPVAEARKDASL